jgi:hypothetical protein
MQLRQSELTTPDRPFCSVDRKHAVHRHGCYERYQTMRDTTKAVIVRFLCYVCRRTLSVLPNVLLPYRAVSVAQVEEAFDARARGRPPPPVTEIEKGCLNRAWTRFTARVPALGRVLGQIIRLNRPTAATLWLELRRQSNLEQILAGLSRHFHTSLLGDYICLQPWPDRRE